MSNIQTIADAYNEHHKLMITINGSEFELASPWRRIAAFFINNAIWSLILFIGSHIYNSLINYEDTNHIPSLTQLYYEEFHNLTYYFYCIILPNILLAIWQFRQISLRGQSIGKRVMKIKVININGQNCGFGRIVLLREVLFIFIMNQVTVFLSDKLQKISDLFLLLSLDTKQYDILHTILFYHLPTYIVLFIFLIMLFSKKTYRRTLQDYLAKTIVIKV